MPDEYVNIKYRTDHLICRAGNAHPLLQTCPHGSCCCQCMMLTDTPGVHPVASRWGGRSRGGGDQLQLKNRCCTSQGLYFLCRSKKNGTSQMLTSALPVCTGFTTYKCIGKKQMVNQHRADLITEALRCLSEILIVFLI